MVTYTSCFLLQCENYLFLCIIFPMWTFACNHLICYESVICWSFHSKNGHNKFKICWIQKNLGILHSETRISKMLSSITQRYCTICFFLLLALGSEIQLFLNFLEGWWIWVFTCWNADDFVFLLFSQVQLVSMMSVPSGTVFVRRALSYLMIEQAELALRDAMQAQVCLPEWPTAFYMQALALNKLGMETDAQDMLNDGASFEAKKQNSWRI